MRSFKGAAVLLILLTACAPQGAIPSAGASATPAQVTPQPTTPAPSPTASPTRAPLPTERPFAVLASRMERGEKRVWTEWQTKVGARPHEFTVLLRELNLDEMYSEALGMARARDAGARLNSVGIFLHSVGGLSEVAQGSVKYDFYLPAETATLEIWSEWAEVHGEGIFAKTTKPKLRIYGSGVEEWQDITFTRPPWTTTGTWQFAIDYLWQIRPTPWPPGTRVIVSSHAAMPVTWVVSVGEALEDPQIGVISSGSTNLDTWVLVRYQ